MANEAAESNVIYGVDFKNKRKAAPALSLDTPIDVLYETTLGYMPWPEQHYVAPESDPA